MDASERIRRAVKHNVWIYAEVEFISGERIYYKCKKEKGWRGPAKVLGKNFCTDPPYYRLSLLSIEKT